MHDLVEFSEISCFYFLFLAFSNGFGCCRGIGFKDKSLMAYDETFGEEEVKAGFKMVDLKLFSAFCWSTILNNCLLASDSSLSFFGLS